MYDIYDICSFAKYFGSGVIIATAFIHLLSPALDELGSPCLSAEWQVYVRCSYCHSHASKTH